MQDGCAELRFDIVANDWKIFVRETFRPDRVAGDEDRDVIDEPEAGFERAGRIETRRFLRPDRQIVHHQFRARARELFDDLLAGRFFSQRKEGAIGVVFLHVLGEAVEDAAHHDDRACRLEILAEYLRAIRPGENGFRGVEPDLAAIDIESGHDFDVLRLIRPDPAMHEADVGRAVAGRVAVKIDALQERAETVPHPDDGYS